MIKATVIGAHTRSAGELLRILFNHPDVEIAAVVSAAYKGMRLQDVHYGLIGETELRFSEQFDAGNTDVVFLAADEPSVDVSLLPESVKIVDMRPGRNPAAASEDPAWVYGLSEIFRKPLVRGARCATVPSAVASASLIGLYPLAANLMLNSDVKIEVSLPKNFEADSDASASEVKSVLERVQQSFNSDVALTVSRGDTPRSMRLLIEPDVKLSTDEAMRIFDEIYDDHRFTHLITVPVDSREVAGTQKCVVSLIECDGRLRIEVVADPQMRGGAGEAVHLMNLLFGLLENTGLRLMAVSAN